MHELVLIQCALSDKRHSTAFTFVCANVRAIVVVLALPMQIQFADVAKIPAAQRAEDMFACLHMLVVHVCAYQGMRFVLVAAQIAFILALAVKTGQNFRMMMPLMLLQNVELFQYFVTNGADIRTLCFRRSMRLLCVLGGAFFRAKILLALFAFRVVIYMASNPATRAPQCFTQ